MKRSIQTVLRLLIALPILLVASCSFGLALYDNEARQNVLRMVAAEVPPHASMKQMEQFMVRHAPERYAYDDINHEWQGLLPQSSLDRAFFDRKVGVQLTVDKRGTFQRAEAEIYYTAL